jgi:hypothetical protein
MTQPWATLLASGAKHWETRSWPTDYRGPIAIHAAKAFPRGCIELCLEQPFARELRMAGITVPNDLPRGAVIAIGVLTKVVSTSPLWTLGGSTDLRNLSDEEDAFGDFSPGRYAWKIDIFRKVNPVPARGALGLWEWAVPEDLSALAETLPLGPYEYPRL